MTDSTPRPGDPIRWEDGSVGRIWEVGDGFVDADEVHVCVNGGSVFRNRKAGDRADDTVSISGGPFQALKIADLKDTGDTFSPRFWDWGDNRRGAHQGVDYHEERPVWEYVGDEDIWWLKSETHKANMKINRR